MTLASPTPAVRKVALDEAVARVAAAAGTAPHERIGLAAAAGRVLAADLVSTVDVPERDVAAMDGYACRVVDTADACDDRPTRLRIVGDAPAGRPFAGSLGTWEAVAVYTGGVLPAGADGIVRLEDSRATAEDVRVHAPARASDIRRRGDQLAVGRTYLAAGSVLTPRALGLAAAMGHTEVRVSRRPRVVVIVTGEELAAPGESLAAGSAFDANGPALAGLALEAGADVVAVERIGDDPEELVAALRRWAGIDLAITSGGASVGRHDVVRRLLESHGTLRFQGVQVKPGGPVTFGAVHGVDVLALPGNPAAAWTLFWILGTVWFHRRLGRTDPPPYLRRTAARLIGELPTAGPKTAFWPALRRGMDVDGVPLVEALAGGNGPAQAASADVLVVTHPGHVAARGSTVEVVPWA